MGEALNKGAVGRHLWNDIELGSLALVHVENDQDWHGNDWSDDGKRTKGPLPGAVLVESLCRSWACKGGKNVWRRREREREGSVLNSGGIGNEDLKDV